jgi:hypothetical protein
LLVKPCGRGFRLISRLTIEGGHMERGTTWSRGQTFEFGGVRWRVCGVVA